VKKVWKYFILVALLGALMCTAAFAVDKPTFTGVDDSTTEFTMDASGEKFEVSYTGATSGQYLILMVKGTKVAGSDKLDYTINDDSIMYVNQDAATSDGVSFTVYPKEMTNAKIMLGGGAGKPVDLGYLEMPEPEGFTVSGTAVSWNNTNDAVYLLYADDVADATIKAEWQSGSYNALYTGTKTAAEEVTVGGKKMQSQSFNFEEVADGTYKLAIFKPGKYVPKIVEVTVDGADIDLDQQKLWLYGDVNGDGVVNANDITQIKRFIATKSSIFDSGDFDDRFAAANVTKLTSGDDVVNANDITQIKRYIATKSSAFDKMP